MLAPLEGPRNHGASSAPTTEHRVDRVQEYTLVGYWVPLLTRLAAEGYRGVGYRNAAQVMLALEAYHTTRGQYPDSLAGLRTYPGWKLPIDPYSGKDFKYRRNGKGYILYSYGEDFDDDGGRPARSFGLDGDLVWTVER
jgi:hypothetical protein